MTIPERSSSPTSLCLAALPAACILGQAASPIPPRLQSERHATCGYAYVNNIGSFAMNLIIWLVVGGVIGWLASLIMRTDGQQGILLNIIVGIVGALLGGWFISPLL